MSNFAHARCWTCGIPAPPDYVYCAYHEPYDPFNPDGLSDPKDPPSMSRESRTPTPYRVICRTHGGRYLTSADYLVQLRRTNAKWACPVCGENSAWDDDTYEASIST